MHRCAFSLIGNQWLLTSSAIQMIYLHPVWMKPTEWMHHRTWAMQHNVDCVMRNNLRNIWNEYLINVSCDFNSSISMSSIAWQFDFLLINTHIIISLNLHRQPQKSDTFKATFALWTCLINSTRLTLIWTFRKLREKTWFLNYSLNVILNSIKMLYRGIFHDWVGLKHEMPLE